MYTSMCRVMMMELHREPHTKLKLKTKLQNSVCRVEQCNYCKTYLIFLICVFEITPTSLSPIGSSLCCTENQSRCWNSKSFWSQKE